MPLTLASSTSTSIPSTNRAWRRAPSPRQAEELLQCLLGEVQQPACTAQGGCHRRRERHLHRLRPDQPGGRQTEMAPMPSTRSLILLLDVIEEMRLLQPSSSIQVSKKNPDRFIKRAAKIIRTGFGQPSHIQHRCGGAGDVAAGQIPGRCA